MSLDLLVVRDITGASIYAAMGSETRVHCQGWEVPSRFLRVGNEVSVRGQSSVENRVVAWEVEISGFGP